MLKVMELLLQTIAEMVAHGTQQTKINVAKLIEPHRPLLSTLNKCVVHAVVELLLLPMR